MAKNGPYQVTPDVPDEMVEAFLASDLLAVDTELEGLQLGRDQVCLVQLCDRAGNLALVRPKPPVAPANLKKVLTASSVTKVFHFAVNDAAFLQASLDIRVHPFRCTKVMSKLVRTYTDKHGLKNLAQEFLGMEMAKENQTTNWAAPTLSPGQLKYAANDVLHLITIYEGLVAMLENRGKLPSGISCVELNRAAQDCLPTIVDLILNGYGDRDRGWETSLFTH